MFTGSGSTWSRQATLIGPAGVYGGDGFANAVALDNGTALLGAPDSNSQAGAAYIFQRTSNDQWTPRAWMAASDAAPGAQFGWSVALAGSRALIGAVFAHSTGAAYVFAPITGGWAQQAELMAPGAAPGDNFGTAVAMSANSKTGALTALVGANQQSTSPGTAYVYTSSGTQWSRGAKLTASDAAAGNSSGSAVSIYGTTGLIGSPGNNSATGAAYVFTNL